MILASEKEQVMQAIDRVQQWIVKETGSPHSELDKIRTYIARQEPEDKSCKICLHWKFPGCALAGGAEPPKEIQANGCPRFQYDTVPF